MKKPNPEPYHQEILFAQQQSISLSRIERDLKEPWRVNHHFHELCEMVIYESIEGEMQCEGQTQSISSGQVVFVPPNTIHSFVVHPGRPVYHVMHFQAADISRINPDFTLPGGVLLATPDEQDFLCLKSLLQWCASIKSTESDDVASTALANALDLIVTIFFDKITRDNNQGGTASDFAPLLKYLNQHNRYQLSVEKAAELCHLSRSHFMNKFKRSYGITFNRFLLKRKIDAAKYLLRSSNMSVTAIAQQLEVDNASYFTKLFREEVGCTPKDYANRSSVL